MGLLNYIHQRILTTRGDIIKRDASQAARLAVGASGGMFLRSDGTDPGWSTLILPNAATANRIPYATGSNTIGESANLTYDGTDLGIGSGTRFRMQGQNRTRFLNTTARAALASEITGQATNTFIAVPFAAEDFDTDTIHSTSSNTSRFTAQIAGKYSICANSYAKTTTTTGPWLLITSIAVNGTIVATDRSEYTAYSGDLVGSISVEYNLAATDYVETKIYLGVVAGATFSIGETYTTLSMFYVGE